MQKDRIHRAGMPVHGLSFRDRLWERVWQERCKVLDQEEAECTCSQEPTQLRKLKEGMGGMGRHGAWETREDLMPNFEGSVGERV